VPWSAVKRKLWVEKRRVAETLLKEVEENLANLSQKRLLVFHQFENARGSDQLQFFGEELRRQLVKANEKVTTINDAMVKYQRFHSAGVMQEGYEKKNAEYQQFIAWYMDSLATSLLNLKARLQEEMREPPEPEIMAH